MAFTSTKNAWKLSSGYQTLMLLDCLKKDVKFPWDRARQQEIDEAVLRIKTVFTTTPTLKLFDNNLPTMVCTDGSNKGVGAALLQKLEDT